VSPDTQLRCAADAGFLGEDDQRFILEQRDSVDVVVPPPTEGRRRNGDVVMFRRSDFNRNEQGAVVCPAGTPMKAPTNPSKRVQVWTGEGCGSCQLKAQCTKAKVRKFEVDIDKDESHRKLTERFEAKGGREFYRKRMSTVEPVFSVVESSMQFVRASSNLKRTVIAETFLKFAAYNINRLLELLEAQAREAAPAKPTRRDYRRRAAALARQRGRPECAAA
jgi:hypothetical protein